MSARVNLLMMLNESELHVFQVDFEKPKEANEIIAALHMQAQGETFELPESLVPTFMYAYQGFRIIIRLRSEDCRRRQK